MYAVSYGDMRTGEIYGTLQLDSCHVTDELRRANTFRAHIPLSAAAEVWFKLNNGPGDMWLLEWDADFGRRLIAGGPILTQSFDADGIDLNGAGIWWLFGHRMAIHRNWTATTPTGVAAAPPWTMIN